MWDTWDIYAELVHGQNMFYNKGTVQRDVRGLTRKGWSLLTFETEVNGDSKGINERSPSLDGSLGLSCRYERFLFCIGRPSRPSSKYFFPHRTLFQFICHHLREGTCNVSWPMYLSTNSISAGWLPWSTSCIWEEVYSPDGTAKNYCLGCSFCTSYNNAWYKGPMS